MFPAKRWGYLALGTITMLCIGTIYGWSVLKVPLASDFGWEPSRLTSAYSLAFITFSIGNITGSQLKNIVNFRIVLLAAGLAIFAGYMTMSFLTSTNVLYLYLCFSLLVGGGMGVGYPVLLDWISKWFPDKYGLCSGVLTMGFGTSALLLVRPVAALFSVPGFGWRGGYRVFALAALVSMLLCVLLFRDQPDTSGTAAKSGLAKRSFTTGQMLRHRSFWMLYLYLIFNGIMGTVIVALAYDYCIAMQFSPSVSATLVGVVASFNGVSRIIFGRIFDKTGRKFTMFVGSLCVVVSGLLLLLAVLMNSQVLAFLGLITAGLGYGYGPVINPLLIREFFGPEYFATNYSFSNTRVIVVSAIPTAFTTILVATGSFAPLLAITLVCSVVAFGLQYIVKDPAAISNAAHPEQQ